MTIDCKYEHTMGRIEAKLESIHEDITELKDCMKEIQGRVRHLEGKSLLLGAVGAGLSMSAVKLKSLLEMFK